jgi:hypothetical protein
MGNVLDKSCRENENTHFMFNNFFFQKSHRLWDNIEKHGRDQGATNCVRIWYISVACCIRKARCTYVHAHAHAPGHLHACMRTHRQISNTYCFSTATVICEGISMLRHTYIAPLVSILLLLYLTYKYSLQQITTWRWYLRSNAEFYTMYTVNMCMWCGYKIIGFHFFLLPCKLGNSEQCVVLAWVLPSIHGYNFKVVRQFGSSLCLKGIVFLFSVRIMLSVNAEQRVIVKFCVKLGKSATEESLWWWVSILYSSFRVV